MTNEVYLNTAGSPKTRICLFGTAPGVGNLGVRALTHGLLVLILEANPRARVWLLLGERAPGRMTVWHGGRRRRIGVINFRLSPRARPTQHLLVIVGLALLHRMLPLEAARCWLGRLSPWIGTLRRASFIGDIRGGDSLSDIYGLPRLVVGSLPNLVARLLGRPYVLLPQTYGPFSSRLGRWVGGLVVRQAALVLSRDRESLDLLDSWPGGVGARGRLRFCPDVAFVLPSAAVPMDSIAPPLPDPPPARLIGLNISGLLAIGGYSRDNMFGLRGEYEATMRRLAEALLEDPATHILLVPHVMGEGIEGDRAACARLRMAAQPSLHGRLHLWEGECDQSQIKQIIGRCDFFIGARMHACIAALSQGIPAVGIAYSRKFKGVFDSAGVGEMVLDARRLEPDELIRQCLARLEQAGEVRAHLAERIPRLQDELRRQLGPLFGSGDLTPIQSEAPGASARAQRARRAV